MRLGLQNFLTYFTKSQRGFLTPVWFGVGSVEFLARHPHVGPTIVPSIGVEQRDICLDDLHLQQNNLRPLEEGHLVGLCLEPEWLLTAVKAPHTCSSYLLEQ